MTFIKLKKTLSNGISTSTNVAKDDAYKFLAKGYVVCGEATIDAKAEKSVPKTVNCKGKSHFSNAKKLLDDICKSFENSNERKEALSEAVAGETRKTVLSYYKKLIA